MALTIEGGEEYVGRAINTALEEMSWSPEWNALRILFVAGNESADQDADNFDFRTEARAAQDRDIIINAMYAGNHEQAIVEHWPEVARAGSGDVLGDRSLDRHDSDPDTARRAAPGAERASEPNLRSVRPERGGRSGQSGGPGRERLDGSACNRAAAVSRPREPRCTPMRPGISSTHRFRRISTCRLRRRPRSCRNHCNR